MRIKCFDYFRGLSILIIVAGHCFFPWTIDSFSEKMVANLITGGTSLFVFISGFFFHTVFYPKFNYKKFLEKKIKNVLFPYLILSTIAFIVIVLILGRHHYFSDSYNLSLLYFKYLWAGRILRGYWYIPFIMIVFSFSPVFIWYISWSTKQQLFSFFLLLCLSIFVQRPSQCLAPVHSFIYFIPIYLLGIIYSINQISIGKFLKNKSIFLGVLTISISALQIKLTGSYDNYYKSEILTYHGLDLIILQKIVMIFFFLSVFQKYEESNIQPLKFFASISFAIYFLHPWVLGFLSSISFERFLYFLPGAFIFSIKTVFVVFISTIMAFIIKSVLRNRSRYIIGY